MERFLAIKHISDCTSVALKEALVRILTKHDLPISRLRGQGYDGASNMRGEFNGLQKRIGSEMRVPMHFMSIALLINCS
jgi:hypothetical protein